MTFRYLWLLIFVLPVILFLLLSFRKNIKYLKGIFNEKTDLLIENNFRFINGKLIKYRTQLFLIGLLCLIISASGPQYGTKIRKVKRKGVDLVILFDTSSSMKAQDIKPSRMEKAKFEINRLISSLKGDRVSIIVFAGTSHLYLPFTTDYEAALLFLHSIDSEMIPTQGTIISSALQKAIDLVSKDDEKYKVILLVTDGEDHDGEAIALAKKAAVNDIVIHAIGVGSKKGGLIPSKIDNDNFEFKRDNKGKLITSIINQSLLREIAKSGNGKYFQFSDNKQSYKDIGKSIDEMEKRAINSHEFSEYEDRFQPLAFIALICFIISFIMPTTRLNNDH